MQNKMTIETEEQFNAKTISCFESHNVLNKFTMNLEIYVVHVCVISWDGMGWDGLDWIGLDWAGS